MTREAQHGAAGAAERSGEDPGGPNVSATVVVGVIGAVVLFIVVVVLQAIYFNAQRHELQRKVATVPAEGLAQLTAEQRALLDAYRWIDQSKGVVGIPIERAMELETSSR